MTAHTNAELVALAGRVMFQNNKPAPFVLARGQGAELWDVDGNRYLDMTAGIAVCALGHGHPEFSRRLAEQVGRLTQTSNLFYNEQQILAAEAITAHSFADRVFFCSSGAEANEGALKLARRYQQVVAKAPHKTTIVATEGSFHGRTMATVSVTGQAKYRDGFGPLIEPVARVPFGDLAAAKAVLEQGTACGFLVEPIQAEGGLVVAPPGYLRGLRELCDATGTLLMFDEVQTGMGRTGTWFGYQHDGVTPDVMTLAKGLGGGIPVGAVAASEKAAAGLAQLPGGAVPHATTYGGNALACAAARAVFDIIEHDGLLAQVVARGEHLAAKLGELLTRFPGHATEVRGRGLLRGLAVAGAPALVVARCRELGVLFSVAGDKVVRFAPSFVVTEAQLDEAVAVLARVLGEGVGQAS
jgi:acetylornithine/N-succinyldiaminopimelate aminotransferase